MAQTTVEQFAGELKLPTLLLLEQLKSAGVNKSKADDQLSETDKTGFPIHLAFETYKSAPYGCAVGIVLHTPIRPLRLPKKSPPFG